MSGPTVVLPQQPVVIKCTFGSEVTINFDCHQHPTNGQHSTLDSTLLELTNNGTKIRFDKNGLPKVVVESSTTTAATEPCPDVTVSTISEHRDRNSFQLEFITEENQKSVIWIFQKLLKAHCFTSETVNTAFVGFINKAIESVSEVSEFAPEVQSVQAPICVIETIGQYLLDYVKNGSNTNMNLVRPMLDTIAIHCSALNTADLQSTGFEFFAVPVSTDLKMSTCQIPSTTATSYSYHINSNHGNFVHDGSHIHSPFDIGPKTRQEIERKKQPSWWKQAWQAVKPFLCCARCCGGVVV